MKITVIGLGYIGLPVAIKLAEVGHQIVGYDIDTQRILSIKEKSFNQQEPSLYSRLDSVSHHIQFTSDLFPSNIYIITVQTPVDENNKADLSYIKFALKQVCKLIKKGDFVILESTVPPYSNEEFVKYICEHSSLSLDDFDYAYCPETIQPGNIFFELETNPRVIGVYRESAFMRAKEIYASITKGMITKTSFSMAEHIKILQNAYRDYEIAFANSLSLYCDKHNMDVFELIGLINQHPRVHMLSPGVGVGGHCLPIDPLFIIENSEFQPISFSRKINNLKPLFVVEKIMSHHPSFVIIFGASYKPNSNDIRHSPSVNIAKQLQNLGVNVSFCEPNIPEAQIASYKNYDIDSALSLNCLVVIAQRHQCFIDKINKFDRNTTLDFVGLFK